MSRRPTAAAPLCLAPGLPTRAMAERLPQGTCEDLAGLIAACPVPVVIDHMGFVQPGLGVDAPGFQALLRVLAGGRTFVKLSMPYRLDAGTAPFAPLAPFVAALVAARPDRMLWATDWPHFELWDAMPDSIALAELAGHWFPTAALRQQVLVDNPNLLYWADTPR